MTILWIAIGLIIGLLIGLYIMAILVKNSDKFNYSLIKENSELKRKIKGE